MDTVRAEIRSLTDEIPGLKSRLKAVVAALKHLKMVAPGSELIELPGSILGAATSVHPKWHVYFNKPDNPNLQHDRVILEFEVKELGTKLIHKCRYLWTLRKVERFLDGGWRNYYPQSKEEKSKAVLSLYSAVYSPPNEPVHVEQAPAAQSMDVSTKSKVKNYPWPTIFPCPPGEKWQWSQITITVLSEEKVLIKTPLGRAASYFSRAQFAGWARRR